MAASLDVPDITIWRRCKQLGLKFKVGGPVTRTPLSEILEGLHPQVQSNKLKKRIIKAGVLENKCSSCGIDKWNGTDIVLQLDHINGKSKDHRLENLRLLCPNCHSQTPTWCGKNKSKI